MERLLRDTLTNGEFEHVSLTQSKKMRAIKARGNITTERRLRLAMVRAGVKGWQLHPHGVIGSPDFYFPAAKVAVFVDGCFWHCCPKCGHIPKVNGSYWQMKLFRNRARDTEKARKLRATGVMVIRFWEHELKADIQKCTRVLQQRLTRRRQA